MLAPAPEIILTCHVRPSADALVQRIGDEAIVLDITSERYFGLNKARARLWTLGSLCRNLTPPAFAPGPLGAYGGGAAVPRDRSVRGSTSSAVR